MNFLLNIPLLLAIMLNDSKVHAVMKIVHVEGTIIERREGNEMLSGCMLSRGLYSPI